MHVFAVCFLVQIKEQVFAFRCRFPGKAHLYFRTRQPVHTKDHSLPDGLPARARDGKNGCGDGYREVLRRPDGHGAE